MSTCIIYFVKIKIIQALQEFERYSALFFDFHIDTYSLRLYNLARYSKNVFNTTNIRLSIL